jgi:pimeloyl-ACP methyl ester carboxylesterase
VPRSGTAVGLTERVQLLPHAGLKAVARLSAAVTSSRDPDLPALPPLPPWLIDDPEAVQPFEFSPSRGGEAGLSVLELNDVDPETVTTVTTESPLQLRVQAPLEDDQQILPVSLDGEFFLPLGWGRTVDGEVEIHIERLPQPSTNRRTLTGSIRIFFKKVIAKHLGTEYVYPLLAVADRIETGGVRYTVDPELVRSRVRAAKRILLYIHGIIGDTRALAASAFSWGLVGRTDSSPFDLVLTFDYENLNTPIEETARDLKLRLTEAGLEPGCAQEVYVVAHSMGGLVARWFIEREGGDKVIRHLVMLGTPNGGSPWPRIVDWATTVIAFGLNGFSKMHWPPTLLGALARITTKIGAATAGRLGKIEVALDEMNPGSSFLQELGRTSQIPLRYSIVAGNTSLVEAILEEENGDSSPIQRLLRRLNPRRITIEQATLMAFFGLPNDIAVSVEAIGKLPPTIRQSTLVREVACDHLTYFNSDAGMKAVLDILH